MCVAELMHFYLQHTRIPKNNQDKPDIFRLYQIAYNTGQLNAEITNVENNDIYTEDMKRFYIEYRLDNISTYINGTEMTGIDELLTRNDSIASEVIGLIKNISESEEEEESLEELNIKKIEDSDEAEETYVADVVEASLKGGSNKNNLYKYEKYQYKNNILQKQITKK